MEHVNYPYSVIDRRLSITDYMHRLKRVINARTIKEVVQWLGVDYAHYKNWKQRKQIPYGLIVTKLLEVGHSIDWLFAPGIQLYYPKPLLSNSNRCAEAQDQQQAYTYYMKAIQKITPLLENNRLLNVASNREQLVSAYFHAHEGWMSLDSSLGFIARATAVEPVARTEC